MKAGVPPAGDGVPEQVLALANGYGLRPVWRNELGGTTYEISTDAGRTFAKWAPAGSGADLGREAARLRWVARFVPVPRVLDEGGDPAGSWLLTAGLPGDSAVAPGWRADPRRAVVAIGEGLRRFHDAVPVGGCPFSWSAADRVATARRLAAAGATDPARWEPEHRHLGLADALVRLVDVPPVDRLVVCHGDPCAPNTLVTDDGVFAGHVDLGSLGVADRWADLAVATWSLGWNYGPGWERLLLDAYGVGPDPERTAFYRLLWDLGP